MADLPTYRAEPDPAFADRLEEELLQRLTEEQNGVRHRAAATGQPVVVGPRADDQNRDVIMLETHPRHDPAQPGRRSRGRWLLVAAAFAAIAIVATLLIETERNHEEQFRTDTSTSTTPSSPAQDVTTVPGAQEGFPNLESGRYYIDPDGDDTTPLRVGFEITAEVGSNLGPDDRPDPPWQAWLGAAKFRSDAATMLTVTTISNLVTDPCPSSEHTPLDPPVGPTVDDLATALTELPLFEVTAAPTEVTMFGYQGKHLELAVPTDLKRSPGRFGPTWARNGERINENGYPVHDFEHYTAFQQCSGGNLRTWYAPTKGDYAFGGYHWPGQTEEYWILDVNGTRLVLVKHETPGSTAHDLAERDAIFDTIRLDP